MISFLDKSTHLFSLVPIWHLSACIKHFYTAIKIQFCIQLCENNCHIADCFSLCYFIFTIIFNDCVSVSIDLPSLAFPLLLDIRGFFCLFSFACFFFYSYYEKTMFVAGAGKMAHWVKVVVAKTNDLSSGPSTYMMETETDSHIVLTHIQLPRLFWMLSLIFSCILLPF